MCICFLIIILVQFFSFSSIYKNLNELGQFTVSSKEFDPVYYSLITSFKVWSIEIIPTGSQAKFYSIMHMIIVFSTVVISLYCLISSHKLKDSKKINIIDIVLQDSPNIEIEYAPLTDEEKKKIEEIEANIINDSDFDGMYQFYEVIINQEYSDELKKYQFLVMIVSAIIVMAKLGLVSVEAVAIGGFNIIASVKVFIGILVAVDMMGLIMLIYRFNREKAAFQCERRKNVKLFNAAYRQLKTKLDESNLLIFNEIGKITELGTEYNKKLEDYVYKSDETELIYEMEETVDNIGNSDQWNDMIYCYLPFVFGLVCSLYVIVFGV